MTFIEAAAEVLRAAGKPMHYKEITELAIAQNLLSHVGKTPEITMSHRLTSAIKKDDKEVPIVKVKPGVFALREWEGKKGKKGHSAPPAESSEDEGSNGEGVEVNALEIEAALRGAQAGSGEEGAAADNEEEAADERRTPVSGEEALRADLAASGAEFFDDEDDDDQPILGGPAPDPVAGGAPPQPGEGQGRRRRRRRRGRGRGQGEGPGEPRFGGPRPDGSQPRMGSGGGGASDGQITPTPIVSIEGDSSIEARENMGPSRPVVRDRQQIMAGGSPTGIDIPLAEGDELSGRELADAAAIVLASFDRNAGPVPVRTVADGRLARSGLASGSPRGPGSRSPSGHSAGTSRASSRRSSGRSSGTARPRAARCCAGCRSSRATRSSSCCCSRSSASE
jgi:hypothetical protein